MDFDGIVIRIDPAPAVAAQAKVDQGFAGNEQSARRVGETAGRAYDQTARAAREAARAAAETARKSAQEQAASAREAAQAAAAALREQEEAAIAAYNAAMRRARERAEVERRLAARRAELRDAYREIVGPIADYNDKLKNAIALERQGAISAKQRAEYVARLGREQKAFARKNRGGIMGAVSEVAALPATPVAAAALGAKMAVDAGIAIVKMGDKYTQLGNRIKTVTATEAEMRRVREQLLEISNRTRVETGATVEVYARMAAAGQSLGKSQREVLQFTESLNKAVKLSGATSQEAQAGMIQLAQGLGSGALRGDELRSVLEQLPAVADVIAKSLGVTRGQLRKLGEDGKITADVVFEAFKKSRAEIDQKFGKSAVTAGDAWTVLRNKLEASVGKLLENTNVIPMIVKAIEGLARGIEFAINEFEGFINVVKRLSVTVKPMLAMYDKLGGGILTNKTLRSVAFGSGWSNASKLLSGDVAIGWKTATDSITGAAAGYMEAATLAAEKKAEFEKYLAKAFLASKEGRDMDLALRRGTAQLRQWGAQIGGLVTGEDPNKASKDAQRKLSDEAKARRDEARQAYEGIEGQISSVTRANQQLAEAEKAVDRAVRFGIATREEGQRVMAAYRASVADQLDPYTAAIRKIEDETRALAMSTEERERHGQIVAVENDLRAKGVQLTADQILQIERMIDAQREEAEARREQAEALSELWDAWASGGDGALDLQGQIEDVGARIKDASDKLRGLSEAAVSNANRMAEAWGNTFGGALQTGLDAIVDFAITGQASFAQMTSAILADIAKIALRMMVLQALQGMGVGGAGGFAGAFMGALGGGLNLGNNATGGTYRVPPIGPTGGDSVPFFGRAMPGERIAITPANANAQAAAPAPVHLAPIIVHDAQAAALAAMRTPAGTRAVIAMVGSDPAGFRSALGIG